MAVRANEVDALFRHCNALSKTRPPTAAALPDL